MADGRISEAIDFLQELSRVIAEEAPGGMLIAEESTAWPGVTRSADAGGLGFTHKWNMGWMHDTLHYISEEPVYRSYHHDDMTFGLLYAFFERFILPISHDEVVYGKRSLLGRMPGDNWQRFANLRAYLAFMWTHPGKKLLFMGSSSGSPKNGTTTPRFPGACLTIRCMRACNACWAISTRCFGASARCTRATSPPTDSAGSSPTTRRRAYLCGSGSDPEGGAPVLVACNFTPVPRRDYRVGVPALGRWREILNTDAETYGGSGMGNLGSVQAAAVSSHGLPASLALTLPPLAAIALQVER